MQSQKVIFPVSSDSWGGRLGTLCTTLAMGGIKQAEAGGSESQPGMKSPHLSADTRLPAQSCEARAGMLGFYPSVLWTALRTPPDVPTSPTPHLA